MMETINAFVNKENYTSFTCPHCQKTHRVFVAEYKGVKHKLLTNCVCKERFEIRLNFRQFYRKKVQLTGEVLNVSTESKKWHAMTVVDLSMSGLRFRVVGSKGIQKGHRLKVRFSLDDQQKSNIDKEARVIDITNDRYGCEFLNLAYEEKELGYYLFPG